MIRTEAPARRGRGFWAGVAMLAALIPVYAVCLTVPGFGLNHDDGIYVVTAKALAEGKGYSIISLPDPVPQTKYPPLLPLLLSLVWRMDPHFPDNVVALRLVPFAALIAWLGLLFVFARRLIGETAAVWICVVMAANQWVIFTSSIVMAEPLFALLCLGSVWFLEKLRRSDSLLYAAAAALLAVLTYATRTAGVAVFGAGIVALLLARRWRALIIFVFAGALAVGAWSGWQRQAHKAATSAEDYYTAQNYRDSAATSPRYSPPDKLKIAARNAFYIFTAPMRLFALPVFRWDFAVIPTLILLYWLNALFWLGVAHGLRSLPLSAGLLTFCYLGMILIWIWQPDRLLLPVLPLLLIAFYHGSKHWSSMRFAIPAMLAFTILAAFGSAVFALRHGVTTQYGGVGFLLSPEEPFAATDLTEPLDYAKTAAINGWIRENTGPDTVVFAGFDPSVYLYTGRRALRPYLVDGMPLFYWDDRAHSGRKTDLDSLISTYRPALLVETGVDAGVEPHYSHLLRDLKRQGRIRLVKEFSPHYRIFEFTG